MNLKVTKPLVSVDWLHTHLDTKNLIILDCTIPKVTDKSIVLEKKQQIKGAIFFDIKNTFSNTKALFPNTVLSAKEFEKQVQKLGINNQSCIVVYDDLGIYSSPRVWWMFQLMGFNNIAVLNGGFSEWKKYNFSVEIKKPKATLKGNFKAKYQPRKIKFTEDILSLIENNKILIIDARSKGRFYATEPEPRNDVKSGHIPNSLSLPFVEVLQKGKMKPKKELKNIFREYTYKQELIFSCGSGITASILALAAELAEIKEYSVYDGSWTEWGSSANLPIE